MGNSGLSMKKHFLRSMKREARLPKVLTTRRAELEEKRQALVRQNQADRQKLTETQQSL
jgi:hypothetical protein